MLWLFFFFFLLWNNLKNLKKSIYSENSLDILCHEYMLVSSSLDYISVNGCHHKHKYKGHMYLIVSVFFSHSSALLCGIIDFLLLRQKKVRLEVQSLNRDNNGHLIITFLF